MSDLTDRSDRFRLRRAACRCSRAARALRLDLLAGKKA
jgi:hypothetical protein